MTPPDHASQQITDQIDNLMGFHPGNPEVQPVYEDLRRRFTALAHHVNERCPNGRPKSIAITHLEDGLMRALQAVAATQPLEDTQQA